MKMSCFEKEKKKKEKTTFFWKHIHKCIFFPHFPLNFCQNLGHFLLETTDSMHRTHSCYFSPLFLQHSKNSSHFISFLICQLKKKNILKKISELNTANSRKLTLLEHKNAWSCFTVSAYESSKLFATWQRLWGTVGNPHAY